MTEISPEAQALIDRLAAMDPAHPRSNRAIIEQAFNAHLDVLGLPARPFIWFRSSGSAYQYVRAARRKAAWGRAIRFLMTDVVLSGAAFTGLMFALIGVLWLFASRDFRFNEGALREGLLVALFCQVVVIWNYVIYAIFSPHRKRAAVRRAVLDANWIALSGADLRARDVSRFRAKAAWEANSDQLLAWKEAEHAGREAARAALREGAWRGALAGSRGTSVWYAESGNAVDDAIAGIARVNGLMALRNAKTQKSASIWRPMVEAFEAGLFHYWVLPHEVVCTVQPSLTIEAGQLHCADGPAVRWPSGEGLYFWHGVQVHGWIITEPEKITVEEIRWLHHSQEVRRAMVEIYGMSRFLRDAGAQLVHEDEFGRLWEVLANTVQVEGELVWDKPWRIVEVEDGTTGPDGKRRISTFDVTGAAKQLGWPIETARAAVAATHGLRPEEYQLEQRA